MNMNMTSFLILFGRQKPLIKDTVIHLYLPFIEQPWYSDPHFLKLQTKKIKIFWETLKANTNSFMHILPKYKTRVYI